MLGCDSPFLEGQNNSWIGIPMITIEDDSTQAMEIILYAIHLQGHLVPETVSYAVLHNLAVVCDKYDLRNSLGAWPETWTKSNYVLVERPCDVSLFIAIAFKLDAMFPIITKNLILEMYTTNDSTLFTSQGQFTGECIPEVILDQIRAIRMETLIAIEAECCLLQKQLQNFDKVCDIFDASTVGSESDHEELEVCQLLQLGMMKREILDLEHPHEESPFRKRGLSYVLDDLREAKDAVPSALLKHRKWFKVAGVYNYASQLFRGIPGLNFDSSWNLHHGERIQALK